MTIFRTIFDQPETFNAFSKALLEFVASEIEQRAPESLFDSPGEIQIAATDGRIVHSRQNRDAIALLLHFDFRRQIGGSGSNIVPFWESGELEANVSFRPDTGAVKIDVSVLDSD